MHYYYPFLAYTSDAKRNSRISQHFATCLTHFQRNTDDAMSLDICMLQIVVLFYQIIPVTQDNGNNMSLIDNRRLQSRVYDKLRCLKLVFGDAVTLFVDELSASVNSSAVFSTMLDQISDLHLHLHQLHSMTIEKEKLDQLTKQAEFLLDTVGAFKQFVTTISLF